MNTSYLQAYFLTVACILGTGFLGLPLTLDNCGFYPFLVIFMSAFVMQVMIVFIGVEILQKCHAVQVEHLKEMLTEDTDDEQVDDSDNVGPDTFSKQNDIRPPDLHFLGEMFLHCGLKYVFDASIILEMISMLIGYAIAGSEAYGELLGIKYIYIMPVFTWCLAVLAICGVSLIQPLISVLSFFKATIFTLGLIMIMFVTSEKQENSTNNFYYIHDPFLLSILSTGGCIYVMPIAFAKIENNPSQIAKYRFAIIMGLATCAIMNVSWSWIVFHIVPQHCSPIVGTNQSSHAPFICNSLQSAKENGEISSVPLIRALRHNHSSFLWITTVVEVFIIISVTLSFITYATALHHMISGIVESNFTSCFSSLKLKRSSNIAKICTSGFISFNIFGIIYLITVLDPKGFLDVMEKYATLTQNLMNILFCLMFLSTRYKGKKYLAIPLPLPNCWMLVFYFPLLYCAYAIGYGIYILVMPYFKQLINI